MKKKIILENNFDTKQKSMLFGFIALPAIVLIRLPSVFYVCFFPITLIIAAFYLIIVFLKKGLTVDNENLFLAYFLFDTTIYKKKINLNTKKIFTIFRNKVIQQNNSVSIGNSDINYKFLSVEFVLLNKKHSKKKTIIKITMPELEDKLKTFLEENTQLKFEIYSPNYLMNK